MICKSLTMVADLLTVSASVCHPLVYYIAIGHVLHKICVLTNIYKIYFSTSYNSCEFADETT